MKRLFRCSKKVTAVLCTFLAGAAGVGYAWDIPGVTEPYDPPNYYSLTSISWADSAPSPFALWDLAENGGNVYDYTRHIKSILYGTKFASWFEKLTAKLGIEEANFMKLPEARKEKGMEDIKILYDSMAESRTHIDLHPKAFERDYDDGVAGRKLDDREISKFMSDSYTATTQNTIHRYHDMDQTMQAIRRALQNSNQAIGETQALQSGAQIEAIRQMAIMHLSSAMGDQIQIRSVHQMREMADMQQQEEQQLNGSYHFFHPGDPADRAMLASYEKETGHKFYRSRSMPDF